MSLRHWPGRATGPGWQRLRPGLGRLFPVATMDEAARRALIRRGFALEWATLGWNVAGIMVLAIAAVAAWSVALAGSAWIP
jgi:hypothetical protein